MASYCPCCQTAVGEVETCPGCSSPRPGGAWPEDGRLETEVVGGQYRVCRRLGSGGFGVVYEVETVVGALRRALKVLDHRWAAEDNVRERFINEAVVLEQINHPNVARCYAAGQLEDGSLYLLLELIRGRSLRQVLRDEQQQPRPLAPRRAVRLTKQIAAGLVAAHAQGIVHRDLKPDNILVLDGDKGAAERVKVVDFGIAKLVAGDSTSTLSVVGTPEFMAPEQLSPGTPFDVRVDLWQLGAVLYMMLTGEAPFRFDPSDPARGLQELQQQVSGAQRAKRPSEVRPELERYPALDQLVGRLLAPDPADRPASASEVCRELARVEHTLDETLSPYSSLALLESLCASPSSRGWWALLRFLQRSGEEQQQLVAAADRLLESWPDELRVAPASWWQAVFEGDDLPMWPLVRALHLGARGLTDEQVALLVENPALAAVTHLDLSGNDLSNKALDALGRSPHLAGLVTLDLSHNRITSGGVSVFATPGRFERLRVLRLSDNGIGGRGAEAMASAPMRLSELHLDHNDLRGEGAAAIAGGESMASLEVLGLAGNNIGPDGAAAIASSRALGSLRELDLALNRIGPSGAAALALSNNVGGLRRLSVAQNNLGLEGFNFLIGSTRFERLELLDASSNKVGAAGAMGLASANIGRRLKQLDLSDNQLGDAGLAALLGASQLTGLRVLQVAQNEITAGGMALLVGAQPQLEQLDLSRNPLGDGRASPLAAALPRMRLEKLQLRRCGIDGDTAAAILEAGGGRLSDIDLGENELSVEQLARLAGCAQLGALRRIDLTGNRLEVEGVAALVRSPFLTQLRALALGSCALGDEGLAKLAGCSGLPQLEQLCLPDNGIGSRGALALAHSEMANHLALLDLSHNELDDAGAEALMQGAKWHGLQELDLTHTGISMASAESILCYPGMSVLTTVKMGHNALTSRLDMHSLPQKQVALLEQSFAKIAGDGADFTERFYEAFFHSFPAVRPLFAKVSMKAQQRHLLNALVMVIDNLRNPDTVAPVLESLGTRHVGYGVYPSHYYAMLGVLLDVLRERLGDDWNEAVQEAWAAGLQAIVNVMMDAQHSSAIRAAPAAPPPA